MSRLARFRGHFYNWYDTRDLRPLDPQYISSVDSGNLAGHLIALANACREWAGLPLTERGRLTGVADALQLMQEAAGLARRLAERERRPGVSWMRRSPDWRPTLQRTLADGEGIAEPVDARRRSGSGRRLRGLRERDSARTPAATCCSGLRRPLSVESHRRDLAVAAAAPHLRSLPILEDRAGDSARHGFRLSVRPRPQVLSIGYLAAEGNLDPSCYDLLASEARLASFMAIAKGEVPTRHWFHLGRAVTPVSRGAALISWSGSMFEYLMPSLVMRAPAGSLVEGTSRLIVRRQIDYAAKLGVPWGVSESAYNVRDLEFTYQYSNFGVPGLGLKRGLGENVVVAPYATALASMVDPQAAARNFSRLAGSARAAAMASTKPWTTRRPACRKARPSRSCGPLWRIIRV